MELRTPHVRTIWTLCAGARVAYHQEDENHEWHSVELIANRCADDSATSLGSLSFRATVPAVE
jgi:hypothetical protein